MKIVSVFLASVSMTGLALTALGVLDLGPQGVSFLTLMGFAWVVMLIVSFGVELARRDLP